MEPVKHGMRVVNDLVRTKERGSWYHVGHNVTTIKDMPDSAWFMCQNCLVEWREPSS